MLLQKTSKPEAKKAWRPLAFLHPLSQHSSPHAVVGPCVLLLQLNTFTLSSLCFTASSLALPTSFAWVIFQYLSFMGSLFLLLMTLCVWAQSDVHHWSEMSSSFCLFSSARQWYVLVLWGGCPWNATFSWVWQLRLLLTCPTSSSLLLSKRLSEGAFPVGSVQQQHQKSDLLNCLHHGVLPFQQVLRHLNFSQISLSRCEVPEILCLQSLEVLNCTSVLGDAQSNYWIVMYPGIVLFSLLCASITNPERKTWQFFVFFSLGQDLNTSFQTPKWTSSLLSFSIDFASPLYACPAVPYSELKGRGSTYGLIFWIFCFINFYSRACL